LLREEEPTNPREKNMAGAGEEARLSVSVYLLKRSKTAEAQQQLEAASAAVYPLGAWAAEIYEVQVFG
jgi:hypothetical protein